VEHKTEKYKGREIEYDMPARDQENAAGEMHLKIDKKHIHVMRAEDGSFATHFLPFQTYNSMEKLSKDIIDKVPAFRKQESSNE
jgi:Tyrosinase co-factor MelC1